MFGKRSDTDSSANGRAITPVPSNASSPAVEDQVPDVVVEAPVPAKTETVAKPDEIGRASCRERVSSPV